MQLGILCLYHVHVPFPEGYVNEANYDIAICDRVINLKKGLYNVSKQSKIEERNWQNSQMKQAEDGQNMKN